MKRGILELTILNASFRELGVFMQSAYNFLMTVPILIFSSLILLAGVLLVINPNIIFGFLKNNIENTVIHLTAVLARLVIGFLLILQSGSSKFPMAIEVLGWVLIVAGLSLAVVGQMRFRKLVSWTLVSFKPLDRMAGVVAIALGGYLIYAFL